MRYKFIKRYITTEVKIEQIKSYGQIQDNTHEIEKRLKEAQKYSKSLQFDFNDEDGSVSEDFMQSVSKLKDTQFCEEDESVEPTQSLHKSLFDMIDEFVQPARKDSE